MALVRDVACNICEAFQPQVSSASFMAGPLAALAAPEPLLHDLSQDPLLDISDAQAARSRSTSPQAKRSKQARDIMDLKAQMVQVLELLAKQGGWEEASQLAQEDTFSIPASGEGASFSSDMQVGETTAEEEPGFEVASEASAPPLFSSILALMGHAAASLQVPWTPAAEPCQSAFRTHAMAPRPQKFTAFPDFMEETGHTFGPVEEEILLKSHREHEAFWQVVALLPPRASTGGRSSRCRASQTQTVTRTVTVPTAPLGDLRYRQQATGPNRQAEGTQDMASPHTSITGGVFRASTLNSHPKLPCLSLGSPSRVPEGWQPQAPFSAQQLQYWHTSTSDSWVLATVQNV
ncbi:UNVERIFIED_CONTAM: hypothetical protein FKN15_058471 [Acipenser sinensis]